jgi:two-component system, chemotaxis family, chemotaxis protein CheY
MINIKRVLIADDSSMARTFIIRCLEMAGLDNATFLIAQNGREALEVLLSNPVDLIVSDINMPEMDGRDLLKRIKSSPRLYNTPVIVVTSSYNLTKKKEFLELGAFSILKKPISLPELSETLIELSGEVEWNLG